jgi:hypothetical protein
MLRVIESFMTAHDLPDVTVVADAGIVSEANQKQIEAAGLSFILGVKIPRIPYVVAQWRRDAPEYPSSSNTHSWGTSSPSCPAWARSAWVWETIVSCSFCRALETRE